MAQWGGRAADTLDDLLADKPGFVVPSISKPVRTQKLIGLMNYGIPILCETPPTLVLKRPRRVAALPAARMEYVL